MLRPPSIRCALLGLLASACPQAPPPAAEQAAAPSATPPGCPIAIVPGASMGPIRLGDDRAALDVLGLPVEELSSHEDTAIVRVGPYAVELCGGEVAEIWVDDLRGLTDCVTLAGVPLPRDEPREAVIARLSTCREAPPRDGGSFVECEAGGVRIGWGMGAFLQIRVGPPGSALDDECAHRLDDGTPVPLDPAERDALIGQVVDLDVLRDYWHPEVPGRQPLRIVLGEHTAGRPELRKFGTPVVYVEAARPSEPALEITRLRSTKTRATIEFAYAVEGVSGHAVFVRRHGEWRLEDRTLVER
jgi:hypothetical protein